MVKLPPYIYVLFIVATLATLYLFIRASQQKRITLFVCAVIVTLQGILGANCFYLNTNTLPPRQALLLAPSLLIICLLLFTRVGKQYLNGLDTKTLTLLHVVRLPVELTLYGLFLEKLVPEIMTFNGLNFDIFSGVTAPFVFMFGYVRKQLNVTFLLVWNFICLGFLLTIVTVAILAIPTPFQILGHEQPNAGVLYFPFIWLPSLIVPIVFLSHVVCIRELLRLKKANR